MGRKTNAQRAAEKAGLAKNENIEDAQIIEEVEDSPKKDIDSQKPFIDPLLSDDVDEKEYGSGAFGKTNIQDIPEQHVSKPSIDINKLVSPFDDEEDDENDDVPPKKESVKKDFDYSEDNENSLTVNKNFEELSTKEKNASAEKMANAALDAYEWLNKIASTFFQLPEDKLMTMAAKGKIDLAVLNVILPLSEDEEDNISIKEFLDDYNRNIEESLTVDPKWREDVKPVLKRVLAKKGLGMTDEQYIFYKIGEDVIPKAATLISLKVGLNKLLEIATQIHQNSRPQAQQQSYSENVNYEPKKEESKKGKSSQPQNIEDADIVDDVEETKQKKETKEPEITTEESAKNLEEISEDLLSKEED